MSTLTIQISDDLKVQLDEASQRQKRPVGEVVQDYLRRYLAMDRLKAARHAIAPLAEAAGYLTDEDLFETVS